MKKVFTYLLLLGTLALNAQVETDQKVISSGGMETKTSRIQVSATIGETIVTTQQSGSTLILTQGFQQSLKSDSIAVYFTITNAACVGRDNGRAFIDSIRGCDAPYTIIWSAGGNPSNANEARGLAAGNYSVIIASNDGCQSTFPFSISYASDLPCFLDFYSGITPNNDGLNDVWIIGNIEAFPSNKVTIFNRLGNIVFEEDNYNNSTVLWKGENLSGNNLPSDTYFYVFEDKLNGEYEKGWIELTR